MLQSTGKLERSDLFAVHREADDVEAYFIRTMSSAARMLWVLGVFEDAMSALYDLIDSACGEQGLWAALDAKLGERHDAVA
jgi:hypothetical protein